MQIVIQGAADCSCGWRAPKAFRIAPAGLVKGFLTMPNVDLKQYFESSAVVCPQCGATCGMGSAGIEK